MSRVLCRLGDLDDPGSAGFAVGAGDDRRLVMVVRRGGAVFGYVNSCPHIGAPLDFQPGRFLDGERRHILCANHGALFRIEDGACIAGPCAGKSLRRVGLTLSGEDVILQES